MDRVGNILIRFHYRPLLIIFSRRYYFCTRSAVYTSRNLSFACGGMTLGIFYLAPAATDVGT